MATNQSMQTPKSWCWPTLSGLLLASETFVCAQVSVPPMQWQRVYGGTDRDLPVAVVETTDGGLILGVETLSNPSGTKESSSFGSYDYWVIRLNSQGVLVWEKTFGGSGVDFLADLALLADGSILVGGGSASPISGNKTTTGEQLHGWLVCLDEHGNKRWEKSMGGSGNDSFVSMNIMHDAGVIIGGHSTSGVGGDKSTEPYGKDDFWIVRLNANGDQVWDRSFGGEAQDIAHQIRQTTDLGFIMVGTTYSGANGNKTTDQIGQGDVWVLRLDALGHKTWERALGGTDWDDGRDIYETSDGGFLVFASSRSGMNGTKTSPNYGDFDAWIVKLDSLGTILWDRSVGGPNSDSIFRVSRTMDRGFLIGGDSFSPTNSSMTVTNHGSGDGWILRLDKDGNELWQELYGGTEGDAYAMPTPTRDGGYVFTMQSRSNADGNKIWPCIGGMDAWVIKTGPDVVLLRSLVQSPDQIRAQGFRLLLSGPTNVYAVEYSTNLAQWDLLQHATLSSNVMEIVDPAAANSPQRAYRARSSADGPP